MVKERSLITPFNIYVINLLILNFASVILQYPMDLITYLYNNAWLLGERACDVYLYAAWPLQALVMNSHALMAINRIWAIAYPISYRNKHSIRTALCLCAVVWLYVHFIFVPMLILDGFYYRLPVEANGCGVATDKQVKYCAVLEFIIWQAQFIMTLAFPIIYTVRHVRRKRNDRARIGQVVPVVVHGSNRVGAAVDVPPSAERVVPVSSQGVRVETENAATGGTSLEGIPLVSLVLSTNATNAQQHAAAKTRNSSHGLLLLALLTVSANICWTPSNFYFTWILYEPIDNPVLYFVQYMLFALQTTIDSIMITLSFSKLRAALKRFWLCRRPVYE